MTDHVPPVDAAPLDYDLRAVIDRLDSGEANLVVVSSGRWSTGVDLHAPAPSNPGPIPDQSKFVVIHHENLGRHRHDRRPGPAPGSD